MKSLLKKDYKNKQNFKNLEYKKTILKNLTNNINYQIPSRWKLFEEVFKFLPQTSLHHFNNRCIITGRKKRINKLYSFSRIIFLKLARFGNINGLKKSSW